jgi:hypothetical protein
VNVFPSGFGLLVLFDIQKAIPGGLTHGTIPFATKWIAGSSAATTEMILTAVFCRSSLAPEVPISSSSERRDRIRLDMTGRSEERPSKVQPCAQPALDFAITRP